MRLVSSSIRSTGVQIACYAEPPSFCFAVDISSGGRGTSPARSISYKCTYVTYGRARAGEGSELRVRTNSKHQMTAELQTSLLGFSLT